MRTMRSRGRAYIDAKSASLYGLLLILAACDGTPPHECTCTVGEVEIVCGGSTCVDGRRHECAVSTARDVGACIDAGTAPHDAAPSEGDGGGLVCTDTCQWPGDGECDDGAAGAMFAGCAYGTDCTDCGPRPPCVPDCADRECGDDGCGGTCGSACSTGEVCGASGRCEPACAPSCTDRVCGPDGCGGSCGDCGPGRFCTGGSCETSCTPQPEVCNGFDDDCDRSTDEELAPQACEDSRYPVGTVCRSGTQSCSAGRWSACMAPLPSLETCDGSDEDCDGTTDEAFGEVSCGTGACRRTVERCVEGVPQSCVAGPSAPETCNGVDEDCDGAMDEGFGTLSCGVGACARTVQACASGVPQTCAPGPSAPETCSGVDDDCDGATDEALGTSSCGVGACARTVEACVSGTPQTCEPGPISPETCNGADDDCDAVIDELGSIACGAGVCRRTVERCAGGVPQACVPGTPGVETCNGLDDDCDGVVDEAADACGAGRACAGDECVTVPTPPRRVAVGRHHGCGVRADGTAQCWGRNNLGMLGDGTHVDRPAPVLVSGLADVVEVGVGGGHSCARLTSGAVSCWGSNADGQLGTGSASASPTPVSVSGLTDVVQLVSGDDFNCARTSDGRAYCWGDNSYGKIGNGSTADARTPVPVSGLTDAVEIAAGVDHACARRATGQTVCWGRGTEGQLGNGADTTSLTPVPVAGLTDAVELSLGETFSCARRSTGAVACWGSNVFGQLGDGTNAIERTSPVGVLGLTSVAAIATGYVHACALTTGGAVFCWGGNLDRQLGDGTRESRNRARSASILGGAAASIAAGGLMSCAQMTSGGVRCWGENRYGQLGDGTTTTHPTAVAATAVPGDIVEIAAGGDHSCGRLASGSVLCWGDNSDGQLGDGTEVTPSGPVSVAGLTNAVEIGAGYHFTCARRSDRTVVCWGSNALGRLGTGGAGQVTPMIRVVGLTDATQITVGRAHACALRATGSVVCWGAGESGQLGNGTTVLQPSPVTVLGLTDATQVDVGGGFWGHTCARRAGGQVVCWGNNRNGSLGNGGEPEISAVPVAATGITDALAVATGEEHACALRASGIISCWGANYSGELGDGTTTQRSEPVPVTGLSDATAIALGGIRSCARRAAGTLACWGQNLYFGTLGDRTFTDSHVPVEVAGVSSAGQLSLSPATTIQGHGCVARASMPPLCWGDNRRGQLGHVDPLPVTVIGL